MLPSPHPALTAADLLSVSTALRILGTAPTWNQTIRSILCLASFPWCDVFKMHPADSIYQRSLPSFLRLHNPPLYVCTTLCSPVSPLPHLGCRRHLAVGSVCREGSARAFVGAPSPVLPGVRLAVKQLVPGSSASAFPRSRHAHSFPCLPSTAPFPREAAETIPEPEAR